MIFELDELLGAIDYQKIMKPYFLRQIINTEELASKCINPNRASNNPGLVNVSIVKEILDNSLKYIVD